MTTNEELRSQIRTALRLAIAYREESNELLVRDEAYYRRGTLRRLEEEHLRSAKQDWQILADRQVSPDDALVELWTKAFERGAQ